MISKGLTDTRFWDRIRVVWVNCKFVLPKNWINESVYMNNASIISFISQGNDKFSKTQKAGKYSRFIIFVNYILQRYKYAHGIDDWCHSSLNNPQIKTAFLFLLQYHILFLIIKMLCRHLPFSSSSPFFVFCLTLPYYRFFYLF